MKIPIGLGLFEGVGKSSIYCVEYIGGIAMMFYKTIIALFKRPKVSKIFQQMFFIGVGSFVLVFLVSLFTGMVLALQSAYSIRQLQGGLHVIGRLVALSITRELGPVLTALVVAGRVGAAITAEIGTMKVTEQIDALETLAVDPISHLVVPRFLAMCIALPMLTIYADVIGILGGYLVGIGRLGLSHVEFMKSAFNALEYRDVFTGLAKAEIFAIIIAIVSCFEGFVSGEGAEGVGRATTMSVVISFILIISADCLATAFFFFTL